MKDVTLRYKSSIGRAVGKDCDAVQSITVRALASTIDTKTKGGNGRQDLFKCCFKDKGRKELLSLKVMVINK